ncbi:YjbF family lipoprotein [Rhodobacter sp. Har01]|uniref:YjbF family lipoprotein n=1 Tax=Rhodobacter sp. Har01 TaxID=2883999 RepID=UPI001D08ABD7|nr:YjbF family lipoprotein [Rhodobacter sp. Har01]MCB6178035.1 YjbF family lipoprotein [Rhodobacter sp. Har01]
MGHVLAVKRLAPCGLAAVLAVTLAGCGAGSGGAGKGPVAKVMATAQQMVGGRKARAPAAAGPKTLSEAEIAASDTPLMQVRIAARGIDTWLTPRESNGAVTTWTTSGGTTFTFRNGLLIETRGLGSDLMSAAAPDPAQLAKTGTVYRRAWYVTGPDGDFEQRVYVCTTESLGPEDLKIAGQPRRALHLRETCQRDAGKLTSDYWLEGPIVRKSRQWASPGAGYAEFEAVKD